MQAGRLCVKVGRWQGDKDSTFLRLRLRTFSPSHVLTVLACMVGFLWKRTYNPPTELLVHFLM